MMVSAPVLFFDQLATVVNKVSEEQIALLLPFITDLVELANIKNGLSGVSRSEFRKNLRLKHLIPEPALTPLLGIELRGPGFGFEDQKTAGYYDWTDRDIVGTAFPLTLLAGPRDLVLAHFGVDMESEEVEVWAMTHGYELALVDDLWAVGSHADYGKLQTEFPISGLGSSADVNRCRSVIYLYKGCSDRRVYLRCWDGGWNARCRFLLRKVPKPLAT